MITKPLLLLLSLMTFALTASLVQRPAWAADTLETFDPGAIDIDVYFGVSGVGPVRETRSAYGELMLGYGVIQRLSLFAGVRLAGERNFSRSVHDVYVGLFGTPLHTEHVDLDLLVAALTSAGRFRANLGFELNVDVAPGQRVFGSYLRGALSLFGRGEGDEAGATVTRFRTELGFLLGSYLTLRANHQLLLEVDIVVRPTPLADERKLEIGSVALGYNVRLTENVELINHVALDVPQAGERIAVQIMIGLIVTVPTRR